MTSMLKFLPIIAASAAICFASKGRSGGDCFAIAASTCCSQITIPCPWAPGGVCAVIPIVDTPMGILVPDSNGQPQSDFPDDTTVKVCEWDRVACDQLSPTGCRTYAGQRLWRYCGGAVLVPTTTTPCP